MKRDHKTLCLLTYDLNEENMNNNDSKPSSNDPNYSSNPLQESLKTKESSSQETAENKIREQLRYARDYKKVDEMFDYTKSNKEQIITYTLLGLGILFMLFMYGSMLGELLIGIVAGYHFTNEILYYLRNVSQLLPGQEKLRYIVLTAVLIALFIAAPGIFIGATIIAVIRQVM
jgi:hypothetical protein